MKTISVKLSDVLDTRRSAVAAKRGVQKSELVSEAIQRCVAAKQPESSGSFLKAMKEFAGTLEEQEDVSAEVKHLEDFRRNRPNDRGDLSAQPAHSISRKK